MICMMQNYENHFDLVPYINEKLKQIEVEYW